MMDAEVVQAGLEGQVGDWEVHLQNSQQMIKMYHQPLERGKQNRSILTRRRGLVALRRLVSWGKRLILILLWWGI